MKIRKPFLLRLSPDLYDALEAWAQQELRSVNGQIEYVLKEAVQKRLRLLDKDAPLPKNEEKPPESHLGV